MICILLKEQDIRGNNRISVILEGSRGKPVRANKFGPLTMAWRMDGSFLSIVPVEVITARNPPGFNASRDFRIK